MSAAQNSPNGRRPSAEPNDIPDISFKTASTPLFQSPQDFEESMIKSGHIMPSTDELTVSRAVVSALAIIAVCGVIFLAVRHIMSQELPEGSYTVPDFTLAKLEVLFKGLKADINSGDTALTAQTIGLWLGVSMIGLLAGSCDILLCRIPLDRQITDRFSFGIQPLTRYLPALTMTLYTLFIYIARAIDDSYDFTLTTSNFSLTGEGYTWCTWVSEGAYVLFILACLFALIEMFSNSGIFGMIIRLPLSIVSNGAIVMVLLTGTLCAVITALMFVFVKVLGFILRILFPTMGIYYRTYEEY